MSTTSKSTLQKAEERLTSLASTIIPASATTIPFPAFDDLPKIPGQPQGCMWGFWDKDGKKDEVGSLNILTPSLIFSARSEIKTGAHLQLDWPLHNVQYPGFNRATFQQKVIDLVPSLNFKSLDDELTFNTQSGSQWDSLKHFAHQQSGFHYNGLPHAEAAKVETNGLHNVCDRGGIVGRGVLIDWLRWYEWKHKTPAPAPTTRYEIPVSDLEEVLAYQGTTLRPGDIALFRCGFVRWHDFSDASSRKHGTQESTDGLGLKGDEEMVRWLYSKHFAAVAGDAVTLEAWPPRFKDGWCLHEWLLVQWGTLIGEMWDLERLSRMCEGEGRWTFFLTSAPLNVRGGVGSPPGAIAIF